MSAAVTIENIDVIFGKHSKKAIGMLDEGKTRDEIHKQTGAVVGVAEANLTVNQGDICVLMGLSGSGKSSLLRCVNGLNKISRGRLLISDGEQAIDIASCDDRTLKDVRMNQVSMVFQQFGLLPWRTVRDNVGFGLEVKGEDPEKIKQRVDEKLELVHLQEWADKFVHELSGGMQQRVGLARALATDADILLMDEPFSALDPLIRTHLQDELLELQRRLKKTIIFVSHDLDEAVKLGNHIVIMDAAKIVQQGTAAEIVFNPANDYVQQFVSNMNPLQVLYAKALMTPIKELNVNDGKLLIEQQGIAVHLNEAGVPVDVVMGDQNLPMIDVNEITQDSPQDILLTANYETNMRKLIAARKYVSKPILVLEGSICVGLVGEQELYSGLLR